MLSTPIVILIAVAFTLVMVILAYLGSSKKIHDIEDYLVAGRNVSLGMGTSSIIAAWLWAVSLMAAAEFGFVFGVSGTFGYALAGGSGLAFFGLFAKRIKQVFHQGTTMPEFINRRFGKKSHLLFLVIAIITSGFSLMICIRGTALTLSAISAIPYFWGVIIGAVTFSIYAIISGIWGTFITSFVQLGLVAVALLLIVPKVIFSIGFDTIHSEIFSIDPQLLNPLMQPGLLFLIGLVPSAACMILINQSYWQRTLAIGNKQEKKAFLFAALGWFPFPILASFLGIAGLAIYGANFFDPSAIAPVMATSEVWMGVLFLLMILGAIASTGSGDVNAISAMLIVDVYRKLGISEQNQAKVLFQARLISTIVIILACLASFLPFSLLYIIVWIATFQMPLVFPLLAGIYSGKITNDGVFYGSIAGIVVGQVLWYTAFGFGNPLSFISVWSSFFVSMIICLVISYIQRSKHINIQSFIERSQSMTN